MLPEWADIAAIVLAFPVVVGIVWWLVRVAGRVHLIHQAIMGRPKTGATEAIPSIIERFERVDKRMDAFAVDLTSIRSQVHRNGGKSLADAVVAGARAAGALVDEDTATERP